MFEVSTGLASHVAAQPNFSARTSRIDLAENPNLLPRWLKRESALLAGARRGDLTKPHCRICGDKLQDDADNSDNDRDENYDRAPNCPFGAYSGPSGSKARRQALEDFLTEMSGHEAPERSLVDDIWTNPKMNLERSPGGYSNR